MSDPPAAQIPVVPDAQHETDREALVMLRRARDVLRQEIGKVIIGQQAVVDDLLLAIFARGHCLMVGVPGLAKTLIVQTIARAIDMRFKRIQFTPDLMPADITGTEVIETDRQTGERVFRFMPGPVFANILLADEINRTPPKTQAALLQAMQERQVTSGGKTYDLPKPFFVLATQNPIEQEGTYPLPEAQLDRFMFMLKVGYPSPREELAIVKANPAGEENHVAKVLGTEQILQIQRVIRSVPLSDHVALYCLKLGRSTRPGDAIAPPVTREMVTWGIGSRGIQMMTLAARARAALTGEYNVTAEHVRAVAPLVLRHRVIANYHAEARGMDADAIINQLLDEVSEPTAKEYDQLMAGGSR